jgi:hypothetical protein
MSTEAEKELRMIEMEQRFARDWSAGELENEERALRIRVMVQPYFDKIADMNTADEIAEFFEREEVKAVKGKSRTCAIAQYLHDRSGQDVRAYHIHTFVAGEAVVFRNTRTMSDFITLFDRGAYPNLVA